MLYPNSGNIKINSEDLIKKEKHGKKILVMFLKMSQLLMKVYYNIVLEDDLNKIDLSRVDELLKQVNLYDHVYKLPKNIYELAGESGVKLSGGQRQRLA